VAVREDFPLQLKGKFLHKRVCFSDLECSKRNHNDFVHQIQRQYHSDGKISEILNIPGLDVVKQFSIDYMHAVCHGAMKKLLMLWTQQTLNIQRICSNCTNCSMNDQNNKFIFFKEFHKLI